MSFAAKDPLLAPYREAIRARHERAEKKENELTRDSATTLSDFATGYLYFGLHRTPEGWVFREWAPNANDIYLVGDFNNWQQREDYKLRRIDDNGVWELCLPPDAIHHEDYYKLRIYWTGGSGERIPAWARRVVQDKQTYIFSTQVWEPAQPYRFRCTDFKPTAHPLLIYECHIGMAQEEEIVGSYTQFRLNILPRIVADGYNCIQIMAIQEHPYYGSFGYHVSNLFAPSSRCGTPEELKELIDAAHEMGVAVIMDIVHSHAVKNEREGLGNFAGDPYQYFYRGAMHEHPAWDSLCYDYGKNEVLHFLLSNCKYWLEEYHFDGFRFDGVTSMLYFSHGLGETFTSYKDYFRGEEDLNAITYLTLANRLIHSLNPHAITIAEEVSGMPGIAVPYDEEGLGFDYRMAMNIPDYWIRIIKERIDEDWKPSDIFWEMTNRRQDEKTISYAESHDQALVGDKTIIFRLVDADMYWHFRRGDENHAASRGIALHKMIRLLTATTINGGYLNFMGNEFGHPEWIDFPRQGNGYSHKYARRQWSLVDRTDLCYRCLGDFDKAMTALLRSVDHFESRPIVRRCCNDGDQVLAYQRGDLLFVFNFNPTRSFTGYGIQVPPGTYDVILNTDHPTFGGNGLSDDTLRHFTLPAVASAAAPATAAASSSSVASPSPVEWLKLYLPARSALVLRREPEASQKEMK